MSPNPFTGTTSVKIVAAPDNSSYLLSILDITGHKLEEIRTTNLNVQIGGDLPAGLYLVTIDSGDKKETLKMVKVRE